MSYLVVIRDHAEDWHSIAGPFPSWDAAYISFAAAINALSAVDYYEDFPPTVVKIIAYPNTEVYATAKPLANAEDR